MSRIRLGLFIALSFLVMLQFQLPLWGQASLSQVSHPFATELADALDNSEAPCASAVCEHSNCQCNGACESKVQTDKRCENCPGSCCSNGSCCEESQVAGCTDCQSEDGCQCAAQSSANQGPVDRTSVIYCQRMAKMLSISLGDSATTSEKEKAIEAAMMMVAETVQLQNYAMMREAEARHQQELALLKIEFARVAASGDTNEQLRQWLGPIYANQNRNFRQLQALDAKQASCNQTLRLLENRMVQEKKRSNPPAAISVRLRDEKTEKTSVSLSQKLEQAMKIQQEIDRLQGKLQQLEKNQSSVRPAGHLEPLFTPDQPLRPSINCVEGSWVRGFGTASRRQHDLNVQIESDQALARYFDGTDFV